MKEASVTAMKKIIVVSHERSGTHFLMNTIALNFDYIAQPWINFDFQLGINFYHSATLRNFFESINQKPLKNIIKSHHPFGFFAESIDYLADTYHIFYIYRDPRDVMLSYWEIMQKLSWDEGPRSNTVGDFMRSAPRGAMLRYQKEQMATVLHRWKSHVESWVGFAEQQDNKIILIRYEDLNIHFNDTVGMIGKKIGQLADSHKRPGIGENVVVPGKGKIGRHREHFRVEDYKFVEDTVGATMSVLGY
ncbi:MAG: sulfotransferase domain-containing protein [Thermodesulfovibrionales bacterium]|nr:sulfotransferase domain-containing protein [Thermodesulfovibrionales bacterium]